MAVAATCFRAKLAGLPTPAGERTARVLAGYRRTAGDRGRGQARPFGVSDLAAVLATCHRPRRRGRGVESEEVSLERGRLDAVIAGLLFIAGMRRSEVSALRWADVAHSTDGDGMLVTVRRSKTNQEGEVNDVRFVKDGVARALRTLRAATTPEPGYRVVPLSAQMIGLRFTAAAQAAGRREPGHRALGAGRAGVGADEPGCVDHRRDARRELEDLTDGGALLRRGDRGTRCCCTLPVNSRGYENKPLPAPPFVSQFVSKPAPRHSRNRRTLELPSLTQRPHEEGTHRLADQGSPFVGPCVAGPTDPVPPVVIVGAAAVQLARMPSSVS